MNKFIQNLANILGHPGVAPRAQYLFARAREHPDTSIRWGKAAEVCAGAALFVALRAEGYSDRTDEIAVSILSLLAYVRSLQLAVPAQNPFLAF